MDFETILDQAHAAANAAQTRPNTTIRTAGTKAFARVALNRDENLAVYCRAMKAKGLHGGHSTFDFLPRYGVMNIKSRLEWAFHNHDEKPDESRAAAQAFCDILEIHGIAASIW